MIVNVLPHVLLLLDDTGPGVAEDGAAHRRHTAELDPGQEPDL